MVVSDFSERIMSHAKRRADGSIPLDISSSNTTLGEPIKAIPSESLRRCPPLRLPAWSYILSAKFTLMATRAASLST